MPRSENEVGGRLELVRRSKSRKVSLSTVIVYRGLIVNGFSCV